MLHIVAGLLAIAALAVVAPAFAAAAEIAGQPAALARVMQDRQVVLLGEVHDNAAQHALRGAALRQHVMAGARPAIAFEQFDRDRQSDIQRARRERPQDADYLIAQSKAHDSWHWEYYRPFVALALEYGLPIVAANLSRADAMRVAVDGWAALFDSVTRGELRLDALPATFVHQHENAIALGHCNLLEPGELPGLAHAQMARDIVLAESIRPYIGQGVVLLAGNGHVRRDIGVPFWLTDAERRSLVAIGFLERGGGTLDAESAASFDGYVITERAERADPCKELAQRPQPAMTR
jgi:uncharacterized iron-regulated protein